MSREEAELSDLIIINRDRALQIIAEELKHFYIVNNTIWELLWNGHTGIREWTNDMIENYFEYSDTHILEWQITD